MRGDFNNSNCLRRMLSAALCLTLAVTQSASAQIPIAFPRNGPADSLPVSIELLRSLDLPESLGTVEDIYEGKTKRLVIYIQDAHANYGAQKNIASIIDYLAKEYRISLVGEEGAEGPVDTDLLRAFPDKEAMEKVLDRHLRRAAIGGAEYASILSGEEINLTGVDSRKRYLENLGAFLAVLDIREQGMAFIRSVRTVMKNLQDTVYSKPHLELDELINRHRRGQTDFPDYLSALHEKASHLNVRTNPYPHVSRVLALLSAPGESGGGRAIEPALKEIDAGRLYAEAESLTYAVKEGLAATPLERQLAELEEYLYLFERGLHLELSRNDVERLKTLYHAFPKDKLRSLLKTASEEHRLKHALDEGFEAPADDFYRSIMEFYATVAARDRILANSLQREMRLDDSRTAILVSGGFHKEGVTEKFRKAGTSYAVITPHLEESTSREEYLRIMEKSRRLLDLPERNALVNPSDLVFRRQAVVGDILSEALRASTWEKDVLVAKMVFELESRSAGIVPELGLAPTRRDKLLAGRRALSKYDYLTAHGQALSRPERHRLIASAVRGTAPSIERIWPISTRVASEPSSPSPEALRTLTGTAMDGVTAEAGFGSTTDDPLGDDVSGGDELPPVEQLEAELQDPELTAFAGHFVRYTKEKIVYLIERTTDLLIAGKIPEASLPRLQKIIFSEDLSLSFPDAADRIDILGPRAQLSMFLKQSFGIESVAKPVDTTPSASDSIGLMTMDDIEDVTIADSSFISLLIAPDFLDDAFALLTEGDAPLDDKTSARERHIVALAALTSLSYAYGYPVNEARIREFTKDLRFDDQAAPDIPRIKQALAFLQSYSHSGITDRPDVINALKAIAGSDRDFEDLVRGIAFQALSLNANAVEPAYFEDRHRERPFYISDPGEGQEWLPELIELYLEELGMTMDQVRWNDHFHSFALMMEKISRNSDDEVGFAYLADEEMDKLPVLLVADLVKLHEQVTGEKLTADEAIAKINEIGPRAVRIMKEHFGGFGAAGEIEAIEVAEEPISQPTDYGMTGFAKTGFGVSTHVNQIAGILDFDVEKVHELAKKNARTNFGATIVAGHPIDGGTGEILRKWQQEILEVTNGKFKINADFSHASIGAVVRSQEEPIQDHDVSGVDFDRVLRAMEEAEAYRVRFKKLKLSDGREGNLVIVGEVESKRLSSIQKALSEAGLPLKWKPVEAGGVSKVFVTLGHIGADVLEILTVEEARAFKRWVNDHASFSEEMSFDVSELRLVLYRQRMLERMIYPDIVFALGERARFPDGTALREKIIDVFGAFEKSTRDAGDKSNSEPVISDALKTHFETYARRYDFDVNVYDVPQDLISHAEGSSLAHHIALMYKQFDRLRGDPSLSLGIGRIMNEEADLIEDWIFLHDIGKQAVAAPKLFGVEIPLKFFRKAPVWMHRRGWARIAFPGHEEKSMEMLASQQITEQLRILIRWHGMLNDFARTDDDEKLREVYWRLAERLGHDDRLIRLILAVSFLDAKATIEKDIATGKYFSRADSLLTNFHRGRTSGFGAFTGLSRRSKIRAQLVQRYGDQIGEELVTGMQRLIMPQNARSVESRRLSPASLWRRAESVKLTRNEAREFVAQVILLDPSSAELVDIVSKIELLLAAVEARPDTLISLTNSTFRTPRDAMARVLPEAGPDKNYRRSVGYNLIQLFKYAETVTEYGEMVNFLGVIAATKHGRIWDGVEMIRNALEIAHIDHEKLPELYPSYTSFLEQLRNLTSYGTIELVLSDPQQSVLNQIASTPFASHHPVDGDTIVNEVEQTYDTIAPRYRFAVDRSLDLIELRQRFADMVPADKRILDAGTGQGADAGWFHAQGRDVIGVDISEEMLKGARKRHPDVTFEKMDLRRLELNDNSVGGIWDNASFHHLPGQIAGEALREYYRVLEPGGVLYIRVKEGEGEDRVKEADYPVSRFFKFWQKDELANFVSEHGFEIIDADVVPEGPTVSGGPSRDIKFVVVYARRSSGFGALADEAYRLLSPALIPPDDPILASTELKSAGSQSSKNNDTSSIKGSRNSAIIQDNSAIDSLPEDDKQPDSGFGAETDITFGQEWSAHNYLIEQIFHSVFSHNAVTYGTYEFLALRIALSKFIVAYEEEKSNKKSGQALLDDEGGKGLKAILREKPGARKDEETPVDIKRLKVAVDQMRSGEIQRVEYGVAQTLLGGRGVKLRLDFKSDKGEQSGHDIIGDVELADTPDKYIRNLKRLAEILNDSTVWLPSTDEIQSGREIERNPFQRLRNKSPDLYNEFVRLYFSIWGPYVNLRSARYNDATVTVHLALFFDHDRIVDAEPPSESESGYVALRTTQGVGGIQLDELFLKPAGFGAEPGGDADKIRKRMRDVMNTITRLPARKIHPKDATSWSGIELAKGLGLTDTRDVEAARTVVIEPTGEKVAVDQNLLDKIERGEIAVYGGTFGQLEFFVLVDTRYMGMGQSFGNTLIDADVSREVADGVVEAWNQEALSWLEKLETRTGAIDAALMSDMDTLEKFEAIQDAIDDEDIKVDPAVQEIYGRQLAGIQEIIVTFSADDEVALLKRLARVFPEAARRKQIAFDRNGSEFRKLTEGTAIALLGQVTDYILKYWKDLPAGSRRHLQEQHALITQAIESAFLAARMTSIAA